jgi:hypothetical protein
MFRHISAIIRFFTTSLLKSVIYLPKPHGDIYKTLFNKEVVKNLMMADIGRNM